MLNLAKEHLTADIVKPANIPEIGIMHWYLCYQHVEQ